ncbi:MAG: hypothetical protein AB7I19_05260 [Planctomycetota bacterium]
MSHRPTGRPGPAALAPFAVLVLSGVADAQSLEEIRDRLGAAVSSSRYTLLPITLIELAEESELSGTSIEVDDSPDISLSSLSLPWRADFTPFRDGPSFQFLAVAGMASARLDFPDVWEGLLPGAETRVETRYRAFGADVGLGPRFELFGSGFAVETLAHLGLAHVSNDADYSGPGAAVTELLLDDIVFGWSGLVVTWGGSLALRSRRLELGSLEARLVARFDRRYSQTAQGDSPAMDGVGRADWISVRGDLEGELPWSIGERRLRWLAEAGYRRLLGDAAELLGYEEFFELGGGVRLPLPDGFPVIGGIEARATVLMGPDVSGWSIGMSVSF